MLRVPFLVATLVIAGTAFADPQQYPFKLSISAVKGKQVVMAQNNGPAPILATINLGNPDSAIIEPSSPIVVVVKPLESMPVATVHVAYAGQRYRISTSYKFTIGDPDVIHDPDATYLLPVQDGQEIRIGQLPGGRITTHKGPESQFAIDFVIPVGTQVLAAREGRVVDVDQAFTKGGNDSAFKANHVVILHADGTLGLYSHFSANRVYVSLGQWVKKGELLGYSGNSGNSTGPHLHFAVLTNTRTPDGIAKYASVPVTFVNGVPEKEIRLAQDDQLVVHTGKR